MQGCILDPNTCYWVEEEADGLNMLKHFSQPMRKTKAMGLKSN